MTALPEIVVFCLHGGAVWRWDVNIHIIIVTLRALGIVTPVNQYPWTSLPHNGVDDASLSSNTIISNNTFIPYADLN